MPEKAADYSNTWRILAKNGVYPPSGVHALQPKLLQAMHGGVIAAVVLDSYEAVIATSSPASVRSYGKVRLSPGVHMFAWALR